MKTDIVLALAAVALFGCQSTPAPPAPPTPVYQPTMPPAPFTKKYVLNKRELEAIKTGVKTRLKDPQSATFGGILASDAGQGVKYVCGVVNAKNSFGGYTGDTVFLGLLASLHAQGTTIASFNMAEMGGDANESELVLRLCKHYGVL
jgi:hypothetical protein